MGCVILPFYLWNLIDRKSYEDFLLKGVSPLSRESRNEILRQRGAERWFSRMRKKEIHERDFTYFWLKKFNSKSEEFLCAPSMNKTWWVKKESKVRKATKASRKSDDDARATRLESVRRSFQGFSSDQKNQTASGMPIVDLVRKKGDTWWENQRLGHTKHNRKADQGRHIGDYRKCPKCSRSQNQSWCSSKHMTISVPDSSTQRP